MAEIDKEEVKKILCYVGDDEREHAVEIIKTIRKSDKTQKEKFKKREL